MADIRSVDIKFGYSCNNNCIHCVIAGHRERLRKENKPIDRITEEIKQIISEAKEKGAESLTFTGGEVTIRKDFFELLEFAKKLEFNIGLQTNGRMFCNKEFAKKALKIKPDMHFEVAIHHSNAGTHDKITRANGSWKQTVSGIENLLRFGAKRVNFKVVISKLNYENLPEIVEMAKTYKIQQVDIAFPHGMGNALKYWQEIVPHYSEIERYVILALKKSGSVFVTLEAIPFCFLKGYEKNASELQYIEEYLQNKTSELRQLDDPIINWQKNRLAIKRKAKNCKQCKYFYVCEGVWEEYLNFYGCDELMPVKGKQITTLAELKKSI